MPSKTFLKVSIETVNSKHAMLCVVEQRFTEHDFGVPTMRNPKSDCFHSSATGLTLRSISQPEWRAYTGCDRRPTLFVRGTMSSWDTDRILIPTAWVPKILLTVAQYNAAWTKYVEAKPAVRRSPKVTLAALAAPFGCQASNIVALLKALNLKPTKG